MKIKHTYSDNYHVFEFHLGGVFKTSGDGLLSKRQNYVVIWKAELRCISCDCSNCVKSDLFLGYGELRVFFGPSWNTESYGFIYKDSGFLNDLKEKLISLGFNNDQVSALNYSLNLKNKNYVSFDAKPEFVNKIIYAI
jgi:hypothetical protein